MNRENKKKMAEDTLSILKQGYYTNTLGENILIKIAQQYSEDNTKLYRPENTDSLIGKDILNNPNKETNYKVINDTTLNVVRKMLEAGHEKILCLNFASAKNPGGGFLNGSSAQEESIARATGLYPCLLNAEEYYTTNRNTPSALYTDYMIYSPEVPIIKNEEGECLENYCTVSIITAPAVNAAVLREREPHLVPEIEVVMKRRIEKVLRIAIEHGHKNLVLGAWGCGVFRNSPEEVSRYFKEVIDGKFASVFDNIFFGIYADNEKFITPFLDKFNK
ncbi:TIGR02452 family protein [Flectobacillus roseus]|uniref:TIGR02452 family protein n=1 Tax=Flectobacillus roseus TaxID=502259 RepID=UPI0024B82460|nr:TIGR02452 family protein [Flectobacillus roseus]MDI9868010.1 TIGR02452 family protein [Flectobacillus roseus]